MPFKSLVRELKEKRDGPGSVPKRGWRGGGTTESKTIAHSGGCSQRTPWQHPPNLEQPQERWANLPPELLLDVIRRVEGSEVSWPARRNVVGCAAVCRLWRSITKEVVKSLEHCGRITFPISLKQPAPRDYPIQCFMRRDRATSTFRLYLGLSPSLRMQNDKMLLAARKIRRATSTDFVISLTADDFSRASSTYSGKARSNFLGTKFTVYDSQPPYDAAISSRNRSSNRRINCKQVSPRVPAGNYNIATISYELNLLRTRGPRRIQCAMHSIPLSSIQEGGSVPAPRSFTHAVDEQPSGAPTMKGKEPVTEFSAGEPLVLKNKAPRWHEQLQCWCLNFRGRVTVASVKNFQLVAAANPSCSISPAEQEKVILQFGKIGKDIFTMDYQYPLSAFQAFAICLTSFDNKPACE
ncbi:tubby-like F-box protein 5 [Zingiber officinale]|uniref:tubby-like F-box protein 5 n=1 Tax=Zingiber officinale TaxID=94328 RepID=UPI001C4CDBDE|nr:tubby-like F-box protein 5 [Zingiber officinale]